VRMLATSVACADASRDNTLGATSPTLSALGADGGHPQPAAPVWPTDYLQRWPVSRRVNNSKADNRPTHVHAARPHACCTHIGMGLGRAGGLGVRSNSF
jgi:hypothetical protein